MLGNGITDIYTMVISFYDMTCTPATVPPILSIDTCVRMKQAIPRCEQWLKKSCIDTFDAINCKAARTFCLRELAEPYDSDGRNPYFIGGPYCEDDLCGSEAIKNMTIYLNLPEVRNTLGVDPAKGNFSAINYTIPNAFSVKMDDYEQTTLYVGALLERGIRVLIYVGNYDWICNWVGNERWTLNLEWTEQKEFVKQPLREWFVDGKVAGLTRSVGGFTFATIEGAGHMAPGDKPTEALALMQRWIARKGL
ncbi:hypothetical protein VNI00_006865 [Paramarasmius palmivorus]|uniref:Uncharacterized protein n=1 Tax=Paramarasmius palmivorus TaxID=297713 RepID=A0AAW0D752_9AGAR